MDNDDLATLILLAFCGYLAYRLIRWLWPIYKRRKELTAFEMMDRAIMAPMEEQQRQATKYGSRSRTLTIHLVNFGFLLMWMYFAPASKLVLWGLFVYQGIGFFVLSRIGVPTAANLAGLNMNDRFWLRIFHAWLWPAYVLHKFLESRRIDIGRD